MPSSVMNTPRRYLRRACCERARLVGAPSCGAGFFAAPACRCRRSAFAVGDRARPSPRPAPASPFARPPPSPPRAPPSPPGARRASARISTIVGQSSLRQSFQGRPRKPLTVSRGISLADRAALLEPPELVAAARQRAADLAGVGRLGVVAVPALAAVHPLAALELDDPQPVRRAVLALSARLLADLAGAEELVLVHPRPDLLGEVLAACPRASVVVEWSISRLSRRTSSLDVSPAAIWSMSCSSSRGHLRRRHPRHVLVERLVHRDPRLRGLRRVREDVAAVVELLDDVGAGRLGAEAALLHHLDQLALADPRRRLGLLVDHPRIAVERRAPGPRSSFGISSSAERA